MRTSFSDVLKWLGERRDGFLISGAVIYGLGYLVWAYNAWRNNLGQLPALEFQYLIAGIIPAAAIAVASASAAFFYRIGYKFFSPSAPQSKLGLLVSFVGAVLICGVPLTWLAAENHWVKFGITEARLDEYLLPLGIAGFFLAAVAFSQISDLLKRKANFINRFIFQQMDRYIIVARYVLPALFCWLTLVIYFDLYSALPQELGGPQPRCAYIDLVRDEISSSMMAALVSAEPPNVSSQSKGKIVQSNKLHVYFSSSDYLLVRVANTNEKNLKPAELPLYELRKEVIRGIRCCK